MERLGKTILWGFALLVAFPIIGGFAFKKIGAGLIQTTGITVSLILITSLPAAAIYGYELHQRFWKSAGNFRIPDADFSLMVIATKPVSSTFYGATTTVQIKRGNAAR